MSIEESIRNYARRCNLMDQDVEFFIGLIRKAVAEEREACMAIADKAKFASQAAHLIGLRDTSIECSCDYDEVTGLRSDVHPCPRHDGGA